jgi:hypothetical protein
VPGESEGSEGFQKDPVRGQMAGSVEMGRKEIGLHRKGGNCPESKWITTRRCRERRSVWKAIETLKKCEYTHKMGEGTSTAPDTKSLHTGHEQQSVPNLLGICSDYIWYSQLIVVKVDQGARFLASLPLGWSCLQHQHRSEQEICWHNATITIQVTADEHAPPEPTL